MKFRTLAEAHENFARVSEENETQKISIQELTEQNEKLSADLAATVEPLQTLAEEKNQLTAQVETLTTERNTLQGQLADAEINVAQLQGEVAKLTAERDQVQANNDRLATLAGVRGIDVSEAVASTPGASGPADLLETYQSLQGKERTEFFRTNKEALLNASRAI